MKRITLIAIVFFASKPCIGCMDDTEKLIKPLQKQQEELQAKGFMLESKDKLSFLKQFKKMNLKVINTKERGFVVRFPEYSDRYDNKSELRECEMEFKKASIVLKMIYKMTPEDIKKTGNPFGTDTKKILEKVYTFMNNHRLPLTIDQIQQYIADMSENTDQASTDENIVENFASSVHIILDSYLHRLKIQRYVAAFLENKPEKLPKMENEKQ